MISLQMFNKSCSIVKAISTVVQNFTVFSTQFNTTIVKHIQYVGEIAIKFL